MPNLPSQLEGDKTGLSDLSPKDSRWDSHRRSASQVSALYSQGGLLRYSERIQDCSRWLEFALCSDDKGEVALKLFSTQFCRVRFCPVCQWRRSLMWVARLSQALPKLLADYPKSRFLFLTLTLRNCPIEDLRVTVGEMSKAWQRLSQRKAFPALGFLKSLEVTRSKDGSAHPHFHCLLIVSPSYFTGRLYLKQQKWVDLWAKSLRVDYTPIVDIRPIKPRVGEDFQTIDDLIGCICEVAKYEVKPSDLVNDADWLVNISTQLHKTRAVSVGGILKNYLSDEEPEDLISESEKSQDNEVSDTLTFGWREMVSRYLLIN